MSKSVFKNRAFIRQRSNGKAQQQQGCDFRHRRCSGYAVEALARSGVGELDLIDDDKVCLTNINRQIIATRKTVGKYKVDVAEERIHDICPDIKVNTYKCFYMPDTADQFDFTQYDYIIDALTLLQASWR